MADEHPASAIDDAFCLGCGYPLRRLESNRCPECGKAFDPADARTMSTGRPLRQWQRRLLRPLGWPTIALALLGTAGLVYMGGRPHVSPEPWSVLLDEFCWPSKELRPFTVPDIVFYATASIWAVFLVLFALRQFARMLVPRTARRGNPLGLSVRRRNRAVAVVTILSAFWVIFGWQHRIGRRWVVRLLRTAPTPTRSIFTLMPFDPWNERPVRLSPEQASLVLGDAIVHLPASQDRMAVMKLLVENDGKAALPGLIRIAEGENDAALLVWELRLIGLCRGPESAPLLTARLKDSRPEVRAAAADAVGILRHPSYSISTPNEFYYWHRLRPISIFQAQVALDCTPLIQVRSIILNPAAHRVLNSDSEHDLLDEPPIAVDSSVRTILQSMMTDGATAEEREAAARALVGWPPDTYQLRVAEWGVWISNDGHMALPRSILGEIPPFVHRTGNPMSDFDDYFLYPTIVTKPIVHLTSSVALAADMEVHVRSGRPWFGYPMPDDFGIGNSRYGNQQVLWAVGLSIPTTAASLPDDFETPAIESLSGCREGYPWLDPHHRLYSSMTTGFGGSAVLYDLGLRWQSLIICPEQRPWMAPPAVPNDPRFAWWARLRQVPSSWVSSRGEAERFLYYDGPTRMPVPVAVAIEGPGNRLHFTATSTDGRDGNMVQPEQYPKHPFEPLSAKSAENTPYRDGLYIVVRSGAIRGQHMTVYSNTSIIPQPDLPLRGDAVIQQLRTMLTTYGLTGPEAEGLIAAWTPQFFQTDGRRFLLRMSAADYDWQCPMQVRPTPTEVVRLGLVLTEFDNSPPRR